MEGDLSAAPRLACDFYIHYCWASDPLQNEGQASSAAEIDLQDSSKRASDPHQDDGQASSVNAEIDLQDSSKVASDPHYEGQASSHNQASDPVNFGQADPLQEGNFAVNTNLNFLAALCGIQIKSLQDISLLQKGTSLLMMAASDPSRQAAPSANRLSIAAIPCPSSLSAAPSSFHLSDETSSHEASSTNVYPSSPAYPVTTPSRQHRLHAATVSSSTNPKPSTTYPATPALIALQAETPLSTCIVPATPVFLLSSTATPFLTKSSLAIPVLATSPNKPAIPTYISLNVATPQPRCATPVFTPVPAIPVLASPPSRWRDEVPKTSPATINSPLGGISRLRAMASPWTPGKAALPSLLVGDLPLAPMLNSSTIPSSSLLLPGIARQSLASSYPEETLGDGQHSCCSYCGESPHLPSVYGTPSTFDFTPLRGRNILRCQSREINVYKPRHVAAQMSSRPRWKMKSELKAFHIFKANLDPG